MTTKLFLMCVTAAGAAYSGVAMPTEAEVEKAVPKVERMLASEKVALESGKMTRAEVAEAAMKLAADADDEAAKLLLMKGAFILHVKDGDLEKAVRTMNALETAIADMPPQVVTNIIETALLGLSNKAAHGARLYRLLDEAKVSAKSAVVEGKSLKAVVGGHTWSYTIRNGWASIEAPGGKYECAVSPTPEGSIVIPSKLGGVSVTRIGRAAFSRCHALTDVTIPPTVTSIGMSAFYECRMKSVTIPPAVKEIGELAFYNSSLKSVTIPEGVTSIGGGAFGDCWSLESVSIPSSVTSIGKNAVASGSNRMKSIVVSPDNPKYAVYGDLFCTKDGKTVLGCVGGEVKIPDGVTCIAERAFYKCYGLTSVVIPSSAVEIGDSAFEWCDDIYSFEVSPENRVFASPNGLLCTKDGKTVIAGVNGDVVIPEGVTRIGDSAFTGRKGLTSVTMPSSVRSLGSEVFRCCKGLESVTMRGEKPNAQKGLFDYCDKLKAIHVPVNAKSWSGMKNWFGIRLVFDGAEGDRQSVDVAKAGSEQREQLAAIQGELARVRGEKTAVKDSSPEVHTSVESILKGMIKVPGRDYWLSATELTQEQWEPIMEFNLSKHKGAKLPVECVSRDDCDVFLEKLNQSEEARLARLTFYLPSLGEWKYAALAGATGSNCWIRVGVVGDVLDMAWTKENSQNETHAVATKSPNAFGFYDMLGNVWEWMSGHGLDESIGCRHGGSFCDSAADCSVNKGYHTERSYRRENCGLRLAARVSKK